MRKPSGGVIARRLAVLGASALGLTVTLAGAGSVAVVAPACNTHECDPTSGDYGLLPGEEGDLIDSTHWESSPLNGAWFDDKGQQVITVHFEKFFPNCVPPVPPQLYFSPDSDPLEAGAGGNYANTAGNIGEIVPSTTPGQVTIFNNSCAEYYAWVSVWCPDGNDGGTVSMEAGPEAGAAKDGALDVR